MKKNNILIYGATGSIGDSVLSLIRNHKDLFNIVGMTCDKNIKKLSKLANEFNTKNIGIAGYNKDFEEINGLIFEVDSLIMTIQKDLDSLNAKGH